MTDKEFINLFKQLDETYIDECREDGSLCGKCLERWAQDKAEKEESIHDV